MQTYKCCKCGKQCSEAKLYYIVYIDNKSACVDCWAKHQDSKPLVRPDFISTITT